MTLPSRRLGAWAAEIDAACDRFEAAWKAGRSPRLEDYLANASASQQGEVLLALLGIELELLARQRISPHPQTYLDRFPNFASAIHEAFNHATLIKGTSDTSLSQDSSLIDKPGSSTAASASSLPRAIGRFEILARLGEGAFGTVYRARDSKLDREVAIKVPRPEALDDGYDLNRFLREAQAAATIHHPNICPVHEIGEADGLPYIVMTFVDGPSLADHLHQHAKPLAEVEAIALIRQLASALEAAHAQGVIHRDLKPANILLKTRRITDNTKHQVEPLVTDFGLARRERPDAALQTQAGAIIGTPAYMSPEQARGDVTAVGPRSDIYALGVILYEMLTGRRPFTGSTGEVLGSILHVAPVPPSKHRPGLDPRLESVCLKAMAKDPGQRYQSMTAFAEALQELGHEPRKHWPTWPWFVAASLFLIPLIWAAWQWLPTSPPPITALVSQPPPPEPAPPVDVPLASDPLARLTEQEQGLLDLIDAERDKVLAPPLRPNAKLTRAARLQADDMARWQSLTHELEGKSLPDRLAAVNYDFKNIGENVAMNLPRLQDVLASWMDSPNHRENILSPNYLEAGVGMAIGRDGRTYYAVIFGTSKAPLPPNPDWVAANHFQQLGGLVSVTQLNRRPMKLHEVVFDNDIAAGRVTDADLLHLRGLSQLTKLSLLGCAQVTDAGLEHLHGLSSLRSLNLERTNVTAEGVAKLTKALPNCEVKGP